MITDKKENELFFENWSYQRVYYKDFNYSVLSHINYEIRPSRKEEKESFSDCFIMLDTETSKKYKNRIDVNYIVAFSISIRAFNKNIVTLYGNKPSQCIDCINRILKSLKSLKTIFYVHNLSYDWIFLRQFLFSEYGTPIRQLNTKSHYPIVIEFANGLILKDSLILAQRKLEKWAEDLNAEHKKAIGKWDYDRIRTQREDFTNDELEYIENDTLVGVECLDILKNTLHKHVYSMPFTATGIPREELRKIAFKNRGKEWFNRLVPDYLQYKKLEKIYHGGFTHANRHFIGRTVKGLISCYDFASSYPFCLLSEKYPCEKFQKTNTNCDIKYIVKDSENFAFMFKFTAIAIKLKDTDFPMPCLQFSKCVNTVNAIIDNGRILYADYVEIYLNEQDAITILEQYDFYKHICSEVEFSKKDYLPKWLTDYVFRLFTEKTQYKGGDIVLYALSKAKLNSVYGMCVQKCVKEIIEEIYSSGEYIKHKFDSENSEEDLYIKYTESRNSFLPYFIGVWCTSYAQKNLFELGKCCETWLYSDTDSCYGINWNIEKVSKYNQKCKDKLVKNNYSCVIHNNREYWLGIAEHDGKKDEYSEFKTMGAKRYCGRCNADNELHITVAGVPKKGSVCLKNDINNFKKGLIFEGKKTGKKQHTYIYKEFYIDENGTEIADSIDLSDCDYLLDEVNVNEEWENLISEEVNIQIYE